MSWQFAGPQRREEVLKWQGATHNLDVPLLLANRPREHRRPNPWIAFNETSVQLRALLLDTNTGYSRFYSDLLTYVTILLTLSRWLGFPCSILISLQAIEFSALVLHLSRQTTIVRTLTSVFSLRSLYASLTSRLFPQFSFSFSWFDITFSHQLGFCYSSYFLIWWNS